MSHERAYTRTWTWTWTRLLRCAVALLWSRAEEMMELSIGGESGLDRRLGRTSCEYG